MYKARFSASALFVMAEDTPPELFMAATKAAGKNGPITYFITGPALLIVMK